MISYRDWKKLTESTIEATQLLTEAVNVDELESQLLRSRRDDSADWTTQVTELLTPKLMSIAHQYGLSSHDAEDILQNTLIQISRNLRGDAGSAFRTGTTTGWLHTILKNTAIDYARRNLRRRIQTSDELDRIPQNSPSPDEKAHSNESVKEVRRAIAALPEIYQKVITMNHFQGMKYEDIAKALDIPVGTVKSRMNHGMKQLKAILSK